MFTPASASCDVDSGWRPSVPRDRPSSVRGFAAWRSSSPRWPCNARVILQSLGPCVLGVVLPRSFRSVHATFDQSVVMSLQSFFSSAAATACFGQFDLRRMFLASLFALSTLASRIPAAHCDLQIRVLDGRVERVKWVADLHLLPAPDEYLGHGPGLQDGRKEVGHWRGLAIDRAHDDGAR